VSCEQIHDAEIGLSYLNARHYDGVRGQFLSQDPAHLLIGGPSFQQRFSRPLEAHLSDPQQLNSYSYARNNPLVYKDPNGELGVLALFAISALVNVTAQGAEDLLSGKPFEFENYVGAAAGGVAGTAALLAGPGSVFTIGAVTSGVEEFSTQGLKVATGKQEGIDTFAVGREAVIGGTFGKYVKPQVAGVTAGRNSFSAVTNQIATKLNNGTINNFLPQTGSKILTSQFFGAMPQPLIIGGLSNPIALQVISVQVSAIKLAVEKISQQVKALQGK
jgi:RHS repeat-associated protein